MNTAEAGYERPAKQYAGTGKGSAEVAGTPSETIYITSRSIEASKSPAA